MANVGRSSLGAVCDVIFGAFTLTDQCVLQTVTAKDKLCAIKIFAWFAVVLQHFGGLPVYDYSPVTVLFEFLSSIFIYTHMQFAFMTE